MPNYNCTNDFDHETPTDLTGIDVNIYTAFLIARTVLAFKPPVWTMIEWTQDRYNIGVTAGKYTPATVFVLPVLDCCDYYASGELNGINVNIYTAYLMAVATQVFKPSAWSMLQWTQNRYDLGVSSGKYWPATIVRLPNLYPSLSSSSSSSSSLSSSSSSSFSSSSSSSSSLSSSSSSSSSFSSSSSSSFSSSSSSSFSSSSSSSSSFSSSSSSSSSSFSISSSSSSSLSSSSSSSSSSISSSSSSNSSSSSSSFSISSSSSSSLSSSSSSRSSSSSSSFSSSSSSSSSFSSSSSSSSSFSSSSSSSSSFSSSSSSSISSSSLSSSSSSSLSSSSSSSISSSSSFSTSSSSSSSSSLSSSSSSSFSFSSSSSSLSSSSRSSSSTSFSSSSSSALPMTVTAELLDSSLDVIGTFVSDAYTGLIDGGFHDIEWTGATYSSVQVYCINFTSTHPKIPPCQLGVEVYFNTGNSGFSYDEFSTFWLASSLFFSTELDKVNMKLCI